MLNKYWKNNNNIPEATDNTLLLVKKNNEEHYVHLVYKIKNKFFYSIMCENGHVDFVTATELIKYYNRDIEWHLIELNISKENNWVKIGITLPSPKSNSILLISSDPKSGDYYPNIVMTKSSGISQYVFSQRITDMDYGFTHDVCSCFDDKLPLLYRELEKDLYYYSQDLDTIDTLRSVFNKDNKERLETTSDKSLLDYVNSNRSDTIKYASYVPSENSSDKDDSIVKKIKKI